MARATTVENLIKPDLYQVFLLTCPATFPFSFAVHPWLVINRKGAVDRFGFGRGVGATRYEVLFGTKLSHKSWGHLHQNLAAPSQGIAVFPFHSPFFWGSTVRGYVEGGEGSVAERMADFIDSSKETYPYNDTYAFTGPNSNTYVQWVLDHFPESGMRLPWNAFGKGYKA
jgi:hypothetical protein